MDSPRESSIPNMTYDIYASFESHLIELALNYPNLSENLI